MIRSLPDQWRERAEGLRPYAPAAAEAFARAAMELEGAIQGADAEELTLTEASKASGYSPRRLRELADAGELPNVGRKGAPRFRRQDLPRKPRKGSPESVLARMRALQ